jgi:hypothetical protein
MSAPASRTPAGEDGGPLAAETELEAARRELDTAARTYADAVRRIYGPKTASKERVPTFRAAYSDRTALLMAVMCRYAYTRFEADEAGTRLLKLQLRAHGFALRGAFASGGTEGFVAENAEMAILAFRGTTDEADWRTNLDAKRPKTLVVQGRPPVCVHEGFHRAFCAVADPVLGLVGPIKGKPIYITGHSLGGAVAVVATASMPRDEIAACYTFGAPRVGDRGLDAYVKPPHYRIVNGWDVVPLVPFTLMGFHQGGDPRFIREGSEDAARWNRPIGRALFINVVLLWVLLFRRTPIGVRDHSIELYGQILFRIARARSGWK